MREQDAAGPAEATVPRTTIAHDFTEVYGGAERIIATAAAVLPEAPFWAIAGRQSVAERMGVADRFNTILPERELVLSHYRLLAPLYPALVRTRSLPDADVLLTSSYAFAHGFRTRNEAPQVCYCYSPLRFAWSMTDEYRARWTRGRAASRVFAAFAGAVRRADRRAANRVTQYVAESEYVAKQIRQAYGREAQVIYPPVDCELFHPPAQPGHDDYYLFAGRLIEPYTQPGIVIDAFRNLGRRLIIAGDGPAYNDLRQRAGSNVEFVGHVEDDELVPLMQRCAATVFPSIDDFGLIPVETMACGRPVLAFAAGGALETVVPGETGAFFHAQRADALESALQSFDPNAYDSATIRAHAKGWQVARFQDQLLGALRATARS
jgi:glycosyltransferase involved in cell wall biosynthesis